ncbi:hypothetical protein GDO78_004485, partial [Eleutherodactylus coqui]
QPAKVLWYDRARYVYLEFCVENSRDVKVDIDDYKITFSCLNEDNIQMYNEIVVYDRIQSKPGWLFVDFDNWRDWDTEEEAEMALTEHYMDVSHII